MDDVQSALNSNELNKKLEAKTRSNGEELTVRGRTKEEIIRQGLNPYQNLNLNLRSSDIIVIRNAILEDIILKGKSNLLISKRM